ncbi:putative TBC1 domain family member 2A [Blattamonas nauphoetae]|uniref:TBC1 domain family member 2A n=1 Tax=Blattamonas nauphoetae TaxID=2049346 RepID=A0ABQ9YLZ4_9EUKA|nr:putative TBC1 domain family member 2A [Blattamonas nauphoetae]
MDDDQTVSVHLSPTFNFWHGFPPTITTPEEEESVTKITELQEKSQHEFDKQYSDPKKLLKFISSRHLKPTIRQHLPHSYRFSIWSQLISTRSKIPRVSIDSILSKHLNEETQALLDIEKDLNRTFPTHSLFLSDDYRNKLRRTLQAYSFLYPSIGYCQSMSLIVGTLLFVFTDIDDIFNAFIYVMSLIPQYHIPSMLPLRVDLEVLADLVQSYITRVHNAFSSCSIPLSALVSSWFLSLFSNDLPMETTLRVWDCLLIEGDKILFRVALGWLKMNEDIVIDIARTSNFGLIREMTEKTVQINELFAIAFSFPRFSKRKIARLRVRKEKELLKSAPKR